VRAAERYLFDILRHTQARVALPANIDRPAANTAAVVTYAAVADATHVIGTVAWSYSGAPTNGSIQITDGGAVVLDLDIIAGGPGSLNIKMRFGVNSAVVVTLAAGGIGVSGKLCILGRWTDIGIA